MASTASNDPVDHARTTRQHAGEAMKDGANAPGMAAVAIGVVALVIGLFAMASGYATTATMAIVVAVLIGGIGLCWLAYEHRRVRTRELRWHANHSQRPVPPPTS